MKLSGLLRETEYVLVQGSLDTEVESLCNDSRKVKENSLFFCIKGAVTDGHAYVPEVIEKGAKVLVAEDPVTAPADVTVLSVKNSRRAMALMSAAWFHYPADGMRIIGVTGTKGKTTVTYMVKSVLEAAGYRVGLIGTIETLIGGVSIPAHNTTPESYTIQEYLRRMADDGCQVVVMEVSSQGLKLDRTAGIPFEIGVFTNIEPDHISPAEHASFEEYLSCKSLLFKQCDLGILNADDPHLAEILSGHTCEVETFGFDPEADVRAEEVHLKKSPGSLGTTYTAVWDHPEKTAFDVEIDIPGEFSVYNSLTAIAVCRHFAVDPADMQKALKSARVKGREETVRVSDDFTLMIDYAHNAMALQSLLETLREYQPHRLICVFGCGGNRSKMRRYEMGEVSGNLADLTVITSDNPRDEDPDAIIADIVTGIKKTDGAYLTISDRREAIAWAIHHGEPGDIIVLAGKGHEDYQEIRGVRYPMDERELIREILSRDAEKAEDGE